MHNSKKLIVAVVLLLVVGVAVATADTWSGTGTGRAVNIFSSETWYPWQAWRGETGSGLFEGRWWHTVDVRNGAFSGTFVAVNQAVGDWWASDSSVYGTFTMIFNYGEETCSGTWVVTKPLWTGEGRMTGTQE